MICEGRQGRVAGQRVRRAALADDTGRYKVLDHPKEWRSDKSRAPMWLISSSNRCKIPLILEKLPC